MAVKAKQKSQQKRVKIKIPIRALQGVILCGREVLCLSLNLLWTQMQIELNVRTMSPYPALMISQWMLFLAGIEPLNHMG